jgi:hypothetical protein
MLLWQQAVQPPAPRAVASALNLLQLLGALVRFWHSYDTFWHVYCRNTLVTNFDMFVTLSQHSYDTFWHVCDTVATLLWHFLTCLLLQHSCNTFSHVYCRNTLVTLFDMFVTLSQHSCDTLATLLWHPCETPANTRRCSMWYLAQKVIKGWEQGQWRHQTVT